MRKIAIGVYGASGYGKEVLPIVKRQLNSREAIHEFYFIDDDQSIKSLITHDVLTFEEFLKVSADELSVVIAIAESQIREILTVKCLNENLNILNVQAENVVMFENVNVGLGHILSPFVTLTSDIKIGLSFHANIYSYVAHDCVIGDYVTFAPGVKCNGNVKVCDHAYIGTGAIIKQGKPGKPIVIGQGAVIGAGSMVTKSIPDGITVFGNPAIELTKENLARRR
jgi:sugar O-acyltransferase (sialic acid O-acetyltransferase NeuD family)